MRGQKALFSHDSDEWGTPRNLFRYLDDLYDFCVDVFATTDNSLKDVFIGPGGKWDDAFNEKSWSQACERLHSAARYYRHRFFFNPPYSLVDKAVRRVYDEWRSTEGNTYVGLLPARTDTKWFHEVVLKSVLENKGSLVFIKGRLKFSRTGSTNSAPFPSVLWILGGMTKGQVESIDVTDIGRGS